MSRGPAILGCIQCFSLHIFLHFLSVLMLVGVIINFFCEQSSAKMLTCSDEEAADIEHQVLKIQMTCQVVIIGIKKLLAGSYIK